MTGVVTWLDGRTVTVALSLNWPLGHRRHYDRADSSCSVVSSRSGSHKTPAAVVTPSLLNDARAGILISSLDGQPALSRRLIAAGAALRHFRARPARALMIVPP